LVIQVANQTKKFTSYTSKKVMKSYQVALKCVDHSQRVEINQRIKEFEEKQYLLLTPQIVKKALELYKTSPKEKYFTRLLCNEVSKSPNIAESAFHWLYIAIKGKVDKEQKVQGLFNFLLKNPQQLIEWLIFGRSPFTEHSLERYWKLKRRYIINLLTSTRLQVDSYCRKKQRNFYFSNSLIFNGILPTYSQREIIQAIEDALSYKENEFFLLPSLSKNQKAFLEKLRFLKKEQTTVTSSLISWINSFQDSRWKSLKILSKQLAQVLGNPSRKLFSALRLIVVFTLFDYYIKSVSQLVKGIPIEQVVPLPFKEKRKEDYQSNC